MAGQGGTVDASAAQSDSTTQGQSAGSGAWTVGDGIIIPPWFWPVAVVVAGIVLWKFFDRKR